MRFPGHETVPIGNRVRVNAALDSDTDSDVQYYTSDEEDESDNGKDNILPLDT